MAAFRLFVVCFVQMPLYEISQSLKKLTLFKIRTQCGAIGTCILIYAFYPAQKCIPPEAPTTQFTHCCRPATTIKGSSFPYSTHS